MSRQFTKDENKWQVSAFHQYSIKLYVASSTLFLTFPNFLQGERMTVIVEEKL